MRMFDISVDNGNTIVCDPRKMHVPPHTYENIAICLDDDSALEYELTVSIGTDKHNALTQQKLSRSAVVLKDENKASGEAKFNIILKPLPGSKAPELEPLDPVVVNE